MLLATGGLGRVYRETTNPEVATGDGVAMAWRAGAEIADIEFVQFHPTALHVEGAPRFLLSEALRGEGAYLRNAAGERFMERYHRLAELAPRDVVSRAIVAEMRRTGGAHVWLDITHRGADFMRGAFPRIYETCLRYGVDLGTAPAPVHPAAHYAMGGVRTDLDGRTNLSSVFTLPAKWPARAYMAPIAWPAIRCWRAWSSARGRPAPCASGHRPRRFRRPRSRRLRSRLPRGRKFAAWLGRSAASCGRVRSCARHRTGWHHFRSTGRRNMKCGIYGRSRG